MKYPQQQFELLQKGLKALATHFEVKSMHPSNLQYLLYQQGSEGQKHNALYISSNNTLVKGHLANINEDKKVIDFLNETNFPLYPIGCNDNHIETAVKTALKLI